MHYYPKKRLKNYILNIPFLEIVLIQFSVYVDVKSDYQNEDVKKNIQQLLGKAFVVKTNYEKNQLIYKTSKSEKIIVIVILVFIFILAAFNLIASLTMLFVEKKDNLTKICSNINKVK